jgi:membrane peptidoglycan carboxypeptidase
VFVTRVVGSDGRVLFQHQHSQKRVLDRASADVVVDVLRQAVERGTGVKARIGRPVAGKTGTGQEWRDAWFVGFTPELATAVWVGFPDRQRSMVPPATRILVTGGSWPAEIWGLYASEALADVPAGDFPAPPPPEGDASQPVLRLVPPVIGLPAEQAEDALGRDGFLATREPTPSADYPPGYVVGASPDSGLLAPAASTVALKVSSGPVTALVPELAGMTAEQAGVALGVAGLAANVVVQGEPTPGGPARRRGLVWRQSPGASTGATRGATVTVYVNPLT